MKARKLRGLMLEEVGSSLALEFGIIFSLCGKHAGFEQKDQTYGNTLQTN